MYRTQPAGIAGAAVICFEWLQRLTSVRRSWCSIRSGSPPPWFRSSWRSIPRRTTLPCSRGMRRRRATTHVKWCCEHQRRQLPPGRQRKENGPLTTASGTGTALVAWNRNSAGLVVGTYVDTITVTAPGAASGSPATIIDTLRITAAPVPIDAAWTLHPDVVIQQRQCRAGGQRDSDADRHRCRFHVNSAEAQLDHTHHGQRHRQRHRQLDSQRQRPRRRYATSTPSP